MVEIAEHPDGLGYIVLYGMTDRRHVTYDEARALIVRHALDAELPAPTRRRAFSRTVSAGKSLKRIAVDVSTVATHKVAKLMRTEKETGTEKVALADEARLVFDKAAETMSAEGEHKEKLEADFEHFASHVTADDIRHLARSVIERLDGVSLRGSPEVQDAGGTYFVSDTTSRAASSARERTRRSRRRLPPSVRRHTRTCRAVSGCSTGGSKH